MAVADQPSGLMDIASTLTQDEIPFKLRCATCNKLAVNAFRLPCCDQAICETCQSSLPDTCPVCAHTPLSSDLCKPNKALRTTLKAFLRTEEKKREKDRQSATPATSIAATPADETPAQQEAPPTTNGPENNAAAEAPETTLPAVNGSQENQEQPSPENEAVQVTTEEAATAVADNEASAETEAQNIDGNGPSGAPQDDTAEVNGPTEGAEAGDATEAEPAEQEGDQTPGTGQMMPNAMGQMAAGGFPNMAWANGNGEFNPMAQFMSNGMFNFQNGMGMPGMGMDPMAANQGMFGGYGMNMNGMNNGMNMGMSFDAGQGMYGGWDGAQNNMWNGGQDKFNPNAFANGMGSQYGPSSGFGGYNMSQPNGNYAQMQQQQFPNQDFQNGYYGSGYGRGGYRGRGRGYFVPGGRGRGGFAGHMQANYPHNANHPGFQNQNPSNPNGDMPSEGQDGDPQLSVEDPSTGAEAKPTDETAPEGEQDSTQAPKDPADDTIVEGQNADNMQADAPTMDEATGDQLHGIPTIDSLDQANMAQAMGMGPMGMPGHMGQGFGRGAYMNGPFPAGRGGFPGAPFMAGPNMQVEPRGQGVEGAPAAPRAMRQGLPNTSVLRHRNFQAQQGRGSVPPVRSDVSQSATPVNTQDESRPRSQSRSGSRARSASRSRSRSRSPARHQGDAYRPSRQHSPNLNGGTEDRDRRRDRPRRSRRDDRYEDAPPNEENRRTRSPSVPSSRRSSRRRERDRDRRNGRRSHRSYRHRSRSRSASRNGDTRDADRLSAVPEENGSSTRDKASVSGDAVEVSSRSHRSAKDRPSRREEERERDRDARRRDRDRDRDRERDRDRDRDRNRDRERDRVRYREKERDRDRYRERDRDRERDKKRSRRDRTESPAGSEYSSRHHSRRIKRSRDDDVRSGDKDKSSSTKASEPEKDPHTLEREARNRERMLKEQQRREAAMDGGSKSSRRRDSRQDRTLAGGRRLNYKYEDEDIDSARAARVEKEREASRWS